MAHEMAARERPWAGLPRVLLIDDDKEAADLYKLGLENEGYAVRTAFGGEQGLALCRSWHPDVVLLETQLSSKDAPLVLHEFGAGTHDSAPLLAVLSNYTKSELPAADPLLFRELPWLLKVEMTPVALGRWIRKRLEDREDTDQTVASYP